MSTLAPRVGHACGSPGQTFRQRGQVLILFVMGATVIFVIGAIVVDIGLWVTERRKAQAAADFAALAAATQLGNPNPFADAQVKGLEFARRNGYDDGDPKIEVRVIPNINGDPDQVQVEIEEHGGSLFADIFGITKMDVGATAIGKYVPPQPGQGWALFANNQACNRGNPPIDIPGDDSRIDGATHSNGGIRIRGTGNVFNGPLNWVCPGGLDDGGGNTHPNASQIGRQTPPINLTWADIQPYCTQNFGNVDVGSESRLWAGGSSSSNQLNDNVICANGDLSLNHDNTQGNVTFAATGKITISGQDNVLNPFPALPAAPFGLNKLLFFSPAPPTVARDAIEMNVTGGTYRGYIHAPNAEAEISGKFSRIDGSFVADTIRVGDGDFHFDATGFKGPNPPPNIHLED